VPLRGLSPARSIRQERAANMDRLFDAIRGVQIVASDAA
jgi:hypothetical protein